MDRPRASPSTGSRSNRRNRSANFPSTIQKPGNRRAFCVKHPKNSDHRRGWRMGQRKQRSVESRFYTGTTDSFDPGTLDRGGVGQAVPSPPRPTPSGWGKLNPEPHEPGRCGCKAVGILHDRRDPWHRHLGGDRSRSGSRPSTITDFTGDLRPSGWSFTRHRRAFNDVSDVIGSIRRNAHRDSGTAS